PTASRTRRRCTSSSAASLRTLFPPGHRYHSRRFGQSSGTAGHHPDVPGTVRSHRLAVPSHFIRRAGSLHGQNQPARPRQPKTPLGKPGEWRQCTPRHHVEPPTSVVYHTFLCATPYYLHGKLDRKSVV